MALRYHPDIGTVVICDFCGFVAPEMVKRRPVVIISPNFKKRIGLCTIVPLSLTEPNPIMSYHCKLTLDKRLPPPYDSSATSWVKGDLLATVSFTRLFLPYAGKDIRGNRKYVLNVVKDSDLKNIRACILNAVALCHLTKHL
jgi:mRNA interferase MazF